MLGISRFSMVMICLIFYCAPCRAAFEGTISLQYHAEGQATSLNYIIKGHKLRLDMDNSLAVLIDLDAHTQTILLPERKSYVIHIGDLQQHIEGGLPKVIDMHKSEVVAGHSCEDYRIEGEQYSGISCVSREFDDSQIDEAIRQHLGPNLHPPETLGADGFLLKVVLTYRDPTLGDLYSMEVTKIQAEAVADEQFRVPQGWHLINQPLADEKLDQSVPPRLTPCDPCMQSSTAHSHLWDASSVLSF